jgi:hypothetical protein
MDPGGLFSALDRRYAPALSLSPSLPPLFSSLREAETDRELWSHICILGMIHTSHTFEPYFQCAGGAAAAAAAAASE